MPAPRHALRHRLVATTLALLGVLGMPAAAAGHASLKSSVPADHSTVPAVEAVELMFTGAVTVEPGGVQVFAPDSSRADDGDPAMSEDGRVVTQQVTAGAPGTYAAAWRVTSDDGHTLNGTLTFHVQQASGSSEAREREREASTAAAVPRSVEVGAAMSRGVLLLALLVVAGGGLFATLVAPGWQARWLVVGIAIVLLALAAGYVFDVAAGRGVAVGSAMRMELLQDEMSRPFGQAALVMAALAVLALAPALALRGAAGRVPSLPTRLLMALVFAALAASLSLAGHAASSEPRLVRLPLDMVHVIAAAIWIGGLVQLRSMAATASERVREIERFSTIAFMSVVVLLLTGAYAAWVELDMRVGNVLDTQYGRIVLAKLLLYAGTMPLAFLNKSVTVPAIARRPADAASLLRQYVYRELFLLLVVVGLTAWLIGTDQPA